MLAAVPPLLGLASLLLGLLSLLLGLASLPLLAALSLLLLLALLLRLLLLLPVGATTVLRSHLASCASAGRAPVLRQEGGRVVHATLGLRKRLQVAATGTTINSLGLHSSKRHTLTTTAAPRTASTQGISPACHRREQQEEQPRRNTDGEETHWPSMSSSAMSERLSTRAVSVVARAWMESPGRKGSSPEVSMTLNLRQAKQASKIEYQAAQRLSQGPACK